MRRHIIITAGAIALATATPVLADTSSSTESKGHEFACTAATVGGAVVGVALGSLLGGGLGRTLFETAGGVAGGMAGHAMHCPK